MIDKEAFILGASRFCKEAGITGADRDAFVTLVADGDADSIEAVKLAMAKQAKDEKKKDTKKKDDKPGKQPAEEAADKTEKPKAKAKPKAKLSPEDLAQQVGTLSSMNLAEASPEQFKQISTLLGQVKDPELKKKLFGALSAAEMPGETQYTPLPGPETDWLSRQAQGAWNWIGSQPAWHKPREVSDEYMQTMNTAMEQARQYAKNTDDWEPLRGLMTQFTKTRDLRAADPDYLAKAVEQQMQGYQRQTMSEQEAESALRQGDTETYKQKMQEADRAGLMTLRNTPEQVQQIQAQREQQVAGATAPTQPPTAPEAPPMTNEQRQAALTDAKELLNMPVFTSADAESRANVLPRLQQAVFAAADDPKLSKALNQRVAALSLTDAEREQFPQLMQQVQFNAYKNGHWDVLTKMQIDDRLRGMGYDTTNPELMNSDEVQGIINNKIGPDVQRRINAMHTKWEPPTTPETPESAEAKRKAQQGYPEGSLEALQEMWAKNDPQIRHLKERGITAEQEYQSRRGATTNQRLRADLKRLQLRYGTDTSYKDLASMTDAEIVAKSNGNQDYASGLMKMRTLAQDIYTRYKGKLPAAAGSPTGEAAVSRGVPAEQASQMIERTPTGLAMERMKPVSEGGVIQRGAGGGMFAPSSTGGYMRGAVAGEGTMPTMGEVRGQPPQQPRPAAAPATTPQEQAADTGAKPRPQGDLDRLTQGYGAGIAGALGGEKTPEQAAMEADPFAQKAEERGREFMAGFKPPEQPAPPDTPFDIAMRERANRPPLPQAVMPEDLLPQEPGFQAFETGPGGKREIRTLSRSEIRPTMPDPNRPAPYTPPTPKARTAVASTPPQPAEGAAGTVPTPEGVTGRTGPARQPVITRETFQQALQPEAPGARRAAQAEREKLLTQWTQTAEQGERAKAFEQAYGKPAPGKPSFAAEPTPAELAAGGYGQGPLAQRPPRPGASAPARTARPMTKADFMNPEHPALVAARQRGGIGPR